MTTQQDMLLTLAKQTTAEYKQDPRMVATLLVGSISQGHGDAVSDIDIMMYYDPMPSDAELDEIKAAAKATGGDIFGQDAESGLALYKFVGGVRIDIGHHPVGWMAKLIDDFLAKPTVDNDTTHIIMSGVLGGLPLHGEDMLRGWQAKIASVPDHYFKELVSKHMTFTPFSVIKEMSVDREDYAAAYELFLFNAKRIVNLLCGLNKIIPPGKIKGIEYTLEKCEIAPAALIQRMRQIWLADPATAAQTLYELEVDLLALINQHHPDLDTGRSLERLHLKLRM